MYDRPLPWILLATACVACSSASNPPSPAQPANDAGATADASAPSAPLAWGACDTSNWFDGYPRPADGVECTTVDVPFDHAHPDDGRTFALRVARHKSRAFPNGKAVFQLAGGPGGASVGQSGMIPKLMPNLLDQFDLVYMDQRGTGGSGYLGCSAGYPQTKDQWVACAGEHQKEDLSHYLTVDAAHDLDFVRQRLGYGKIYLRGGSYGTRLGLEYLRQHGDNVVAAVLDGLCPPDIDLWGAQIVEFDRAVGKLVSDCSASAACQTVNPTLLSDLTTRRTALRATPRAILVGGQPTTEDEGLYLEVLDAALYDATHYFQIPRAIHKALAGDMSQWDQIMTDMLGQTIAEPAQKLGVAPSHPSPRLTPSRHYGPDYVAPGLWMPVTCAEYLANSAGVDARKAAAAQQTWGNVYDDTAEACAAWNVNGISTDLRSPVSSNAKVLLTNGEIDINTFPEWGAHAAATLPSSTNLVFKYATHEAMVTPCGASVITAFLEADGDMSRVDTSCMQKLAEPAW